MKLSIALTTFNGARFLQAQLDSYVAQRRLPDELVVCDDGSRDGTREILLRFARVAPFEVRIIENEKNLGFTKNFEKAASLCTSEVVCFSDHDDVWLSEKLAVIEATFLQQPGTMAMVHDGELVDAELRSHGASKIRQVLGGFGTTDALVVGALTAVRREFLLHALPVPDGIQGHDVWIHALARVLGVRAVVPRSVQLLRRHGANTSDWIGSSVTPIGKLDVLRSHMRTLPAADYSDRRLINLSLRERVLQMHAAGALNLDDALVNRVLCELDRERKSIERRDALTSQGFFERKATAVRLLLDGDYEYFNGYSSFLRDLIR